MSASPQITEVIHESASSGIKLVLLAGLKYGVLFPNGKLKRYKTLGIALSQFKRATGDRRGKK